MTLEDILFEINVLAREVKDLLILLQDSDAGSSQQVGAVTYFGINALAKIQELSDMEK